MARKAANFSRQFYERIVEYYFASFPQYLIVEVYIFDSESSDKKNLDCQMLGQNETRFWLVRDPLMLIQTAR